MMGPNGLVSSEDGEWFYVGGWSYMALVRISRGKLPVEVELIPVGFNVDNVRWGKTAALSRQDISDVVLVIAIVTHQPRGSRRLTPKILRWNNLLISMGATFLRWELWL